MTRLVKELLSMYVVLVAIFVVALLVVGAVAFGLALPVVAIAHLASSIFGLPPDIVAVIGLAGVVVSLWAVSLFDKLTKW